VIAGVAAAELSGEPRGEARRRRVVRAGARRKRPVRVASFFSYLGLGYPLSPNVLDAGVNKQEEITGEFGSLVQQAYKQNGVVFACMLVRMLLFSEARFQFRQMRGGRPGDLFGTPGAELLEKPWVERHDRRRC
jgi:hypothetical protein